MAGLEPAIHAVPFRISLTRVHSVAVWMGGSSLATTSEGVTGGRRLGPTVTGDD